MEFSKPQQFKARLEESISLTDSFLHLKFELIEPHRMPFIAGQYVSVKVDQSGNRRSYSIVSRSDIDHGFELLVDTKPQGLGSKFFQQLQPGNEIEFLGPLGRFVVADDPDSVSKETELALVATGSGLAPLYSMLQDLLQVKQDPRPITLYWGVRYVSDLFWTDDLEDLMEAFPNFKFHPVVSRPVPEWILCSGRVTNCLQVHDIPMTAGYYLCGNAQMIQDVQALLQMRAIPAERIHHEKFY